jgi:hypothetical protein
LIYAKIAERTVETSDFLSSVVEVDVSYCFDEGTIREKR